MSLFGRKEKKEIERLHELLPEDGKKIVALEEELAAVNDEVKKAVDQYNKLKDACDAVQREIDAKNAELEEVKDELVETRDEVLLQSFGLYTPRYAFMRSEEYKAELLGIRAEQKDMIRDGSAVTGSTSWTVNGDVRRGKKMVADTQKLLLRAFNAECDDAIEHVRYSNLDASKKKIERSRDAISKLGDIMSIRIAHDYYQLKLKEMYLAFEYQEKKQEEKEEQREARARLREEQKLAREIEEERKKLEKEQKHYENALKQLKMQIAAAPQEEQEALAAKKEELESQLKKIDKEFKDVDYREANQKAGYVYVISNIGAFGENVYKIGMTRRLVPEDRVDELGDASVPFNFDIHAMIFSEDAPKLEAALHNAFADRKVNFVNQRREFFWVSLDEIKRVVHENFDGTAEFTDIAPAEQYRESLKIREQQQK